MWTGKGTRQTRTRVVGLIKLGKLAGSLHKLDLNYNKMNKSVIIWWLECPIKSSIADDL